MLRRIFITAVAVFFVCIGACAPACATAFTLTATGNWNDPTKWSGGSGSDYPLTSGDTAALGSNFTVTIPGGITVAPGAITGGGGGGITITGTLTANGSIQPAANFTLTISAGGTIDINGQTRTPQGNINYVFSGTSGNHATVKSTVTGGIFSIGATGFRNINATYTDFSDLGSSDFGWSRGQSNVTQTFTHNTVIRCDHFGLDNDTTGTNVGFVIENNDFRTPSPANPIGSSIYQPFVQLSSRAKGTATRSFANNTFSTAGNSGAAYVQAQGATISGNVFSNWALALAQNSGGNSDHTLSGNFFANQSSYDQFFQSAGGKNNFNASTSNYYYYTRGAGSHPFGSLPSALSATLRATGDVLEQSNLAAGTTAWFLWSGLTTSAQIDHELMLSPGGLFVITGSITPPTLDISNNTLFSYSEGLALAGNDCTAGNAGAYPFLVWAESTGKITPGTTSEVYNNLVIRPDTAQTRGYAIDLVNNTTDQITYLNNNAGYGYPGGIQSPPVSYFSTCVKVTAGVGVNDISADPSFVDRTRNLAAFDTSNGGAGTGANAITELLKLNGYGGTYNSNYSAANAVTYVRAGFVPHAYALKGTGRSGADIGALPVQLISGGLMLRGVNFLLKRDVKNDNDNSPMWLDAAA